MRVSHSAGSVALLLRLLVKTAIAVEVIGAQPVGEMHDRSLEFRPVTGRSSKIGEVLMCLAGHNRGKRLDLIEVRAAVEPGPTAPLAPTIGKCLVLAVGARAIVEGHPDIVRDAEVVADRFPRRVTYRRYSALVSERWGVVMASGAEQDSVQSRIDHGLGYEAGSL